MMLALGFLIYLKVKCFFDFRHLSKNFLPFFSVFFRLLSVDKIVFLCGK